MGAMSEMAEQWLSQAHNGTQLGGQTLGRWEGNFFGYAPDPDDDTSAFLVTMVLALEDIVRQLAATCDELAGS